MCRISLGIRLINLEHHPEHNGLDATIQSNYEILCGTKMQNITGWNLGSKTLLAELGKLPLKFTCPDGTSPCPATQLNKGNLHFEENITCRAGQVWVLFYMDYCRFLPNSLANCNGASGYVACCNSSIDNSSTNCCTVFKDNEKNRL